MLFQSAAGAEARANLPRPAEPLLPGGGDGPAGGDSAAPPGLSVTSCDLARNPGPSLFFLIFVLVVVCFPASSPRCIFLQRFYSKLQSALPRYGVTAGPLKTCGVAGSGAGGSAGALREGEGGAGGGSAAGQPRAGRGARAEPLLLWGH